MIFYRPLYTDNTYLSEIPKCWNPNGSLILNVRSIFCVNFFCICMFSESLQMQTKRSTTRNHGGSVAQFIKDRTIGHNEGWHSVFLPRPPIHYIRSLLYQTPCGPFRWLSGRMVIIGACNKAKETADMNTSIHIRPHTVNLFSFLLRCVCINWLFHSTV